MSDVTAEQVEELVASYPKIVNFGNEADAASDDWIERAEHRLGFPLSTSYKWFIKRYGGGEIGGEEIYSIYGLDFDTANGGDIVYQHIIGQSIGIIAENKVVVSETDYGEIYFFNYLYHSDAECPVYLRLPSGDEVLYSENFFEFLCKRIKAHISE
ncbi:SMI1/KNR4 family protein (plasmid) [Rhizobium leguminosarum bv. viciae 248]|uniref:SMI1/KNR4 family protein n=1 Tax=Rhizobium leguminosarum TaxID=384 RepID=UPI00036D8135|nr:SMI1/KNR4 family protein [Rhizobium leguminosarum]MCA2406937.1 SMI1/KNR4 family protein [Rhizobium leguminosarum]NKM60642.1 SMI1/KNR4 family protein [Rhizobium leguminosarum bv. viciae]QHW28556.1 SMI1/KNR4 family protein [Rhizobium leguminosarum bv. viciae 248]